MTTRTLSLLLLLSTVHAEEDAVSRLLGASRAGDKARVEQILGEGVAVNAANADGTTALMAAAEEHRVEIVRLLLARDADPKAIDAHGDSVLMTAITSFDGFQWTAWFRARGEAREELETRRTRQHAVIRMLLEAGAAPDGDPLLSTLEGGRFDLADLLIRAGASLDRAFEGETIAGIAYREALRDEREELFSFLLKHRARPDRALVWRAMKKNRSDILLRFLRAGIELSGNYGPDYKSAPLIVHAAELGNAQLVDALIRSGADVNAKDNDGDTALVVAVRRSRNLRPITMPGAPEWAVASSTRDYERSSRNFIATAELLLAAGATTKDDPVIPEDLIAYLRKFLDVLSTREFRSFPSLACTEDGTPYPESVADHPHFEMVLVPLLAEVKTLLELTLRTRPLWSRGVCPKGVPRVDAEGDRAALRAGSMRLRFLKVDGRWRLVAGPPEWMDKAAEKRKEDKRTLEREFRALSAAGYHDAAVRAGRKYLQLEELKGFERFLATWALGNAQVSAGDYEGAEKSLQAALEMAREKFRWLPLESLTALACMRGDMPRARRLASELQAEMSYVIEEFDSDDRHRRTLMWARFAQAYGNVGAALSLAGRHAEARAVLEEAQRAVERAEGAAAPTALGISLQLATLYALSGQTESAISAYTDLSNRLESGSGASGAMGVQVQANLATLQQMRGNVDAARQHLERALKSGRGVYGSSPDYAMLLVQKGGVLMLQGESDAATASYREASDMLRDTASGVVPMAALGLASTALAGGDTAAAAAHLETAAQSTSRSFGADHRNMTLVHAMRAELLRRDAKIEEAIAELDTALDIVERERGQFRNDFDRRRYLAMVEGFYGAHAALCLEAGDPRRAFESVERHKAKSLMELLASKPFQPRQGGEDVAALEAIDDRVRRAAPRSMTSLDGATRSGAAIALPEEQIDAQRHAVVQRLRRLNPELAALVTVTWPKVEEIQRALDKDTRLVEFHALGAAPLPGAPAGQVIAIAIGPDHFRVVRLAIAPRELEELATAFARNVSDRRSPLATVDAQAGRLYDALFRPVEQDLEGAKTLVVVPYGKLHYVPFAALRAGESYLTDRCRLVHAPSAGIYSMLKARRAAPASGFLSLADPASYLKRLPGAETEVEEIRQYFEDSVVFAGEKATEQTLKSLEAPPAVFHYAGHGVFDAGAPELSHLALAPEGKDDGRLEAHEIHGLDFRGTRLVVLSACQGATGALGGGDEIVGLVRPFLATGARAVVASLWSVDDNATARWMAQFYESLAKDGVPPTDAVRLGQARVRRSSLYRHPYFWAAFPALRRAVIANTRRPP